MFSGPSFSVLLDIDPDPFSIFSGLRKGGTLSADSLKTEELEEENLSPASLEGWRLTEEPLGDTDPAREGGLDPPFIKMPAWKQ